MKKEILRQEEHEDGSYTIVEKTTQTPEDGFVRHKHRERGHSRTVYIKGHATTVTYESTNPKTMLKAMLLIYPFAVLMLGGMFWLLITLAKEDPKAVASLKLMLTLAVVVIGWSFFHTLQGIRKRMKESREKERQAMDE